MTEIQKDHTTNSVNPKQEEWVGGLLHPEQHILLPKQSSFETMGNANISL